MNELDKPVCVAIDKVAELSIALGVAPINNLDGCWEHQVDSHWWIALNGHKEPIKTSKGVEVEPFSCYVEFNGWPAGIFNPFGGGFAAGELANEDTFIEALEKAIVACS